jgi:hypothetical protein
VLADPGDSPGCVAGLSARHDLGRGVAVCLPQPGPGAATALAGDLLIALGKFPGALAAEHLSRRGHQLAGLWLRAEQVQDLVVLRADRLPARCWTTLAALTADAGTRLWLVVHRAAAAPGQLAALAPAAGRPPPVLRPWRAALAFLPDPGPDNSGGPAFPAVPDVEFPLFRAAARRLLDPAAFAYVDAVYLDTYARAGACAGLLRGRGTAASVGERAAAVFQQLTIDAASAGEVLTRVRAAQAGLLAQGLFLDLDLPAARAWKNSQPCLDDVTVTRLRGLADPAAAAAVTLTRATGMRLDQLGALRCCDMSDGDAGLQVRTRGVTYRLPARAAGPVRAAVLDRHPADAGDVTANQEPLFTGATGAPMTARQLRKLCDQGAVHAGVTSSSPRWLPDRAVTDLRDAPPAVS